MTPLELREVDIPGLGDKYVADRLLLLMLLMSPPAASSLQPARLAASMADLHGPRVLAHSSAAGWHASLHGADPPAAREAESDPEHGEVHD